MAGSWTTPVYNLVSSGSAFKTITLEFTADSADHTIPNYAFPAAMLVFAKGLYIYSVKTIPGNTAPTDQYDVVFNDADGFDVLQGGLANRSATNVEQIFPSAVPVDETLTVVVTNNLVNSGSATIKIYLAR